ncbi:MAG TPA: hypothetical protein VGA45_06375 [Actinomycetota bacterium]
MAAPQRFLDFTGTAVVYQAGFNLNGIWFAAGGRQLLTVQSNTGKLFRIGVADRSVAEIPVAGGPLTNGDGILLAGPALHTPTTLALLGTRLLVVNSQFDRQGPGLVPDLPFTVSAVPLERVLLGQAG